MTAVCNESIVGYANGQRGDRATIPVRAFTRCGEDVATGPDIELGTASDNAGESCAEYIESSGGTTEAAEDSKGLVSEGCVRLGDEAAADVWSVMRAEPVEEDVGIEGAFGAMG